MSYGKGYDYGLNFWLGGQYRPEQGCPGKPSIKLLTSKKYWFGDGYFGVQQNKYYCWEYFQATNGAPFPGAGPYCWMTTDTPFYGKGHPGGFTANFVFGDGHVEGKTKNEVYSLGTSGAAFKEWCGKQ
jgi:prepilin-type processing-associated H-X9-DG protein